MLQITTIRSEESLRTRKMKKGFTFQLTPHVEENNSNFTSTSFDFNGSSSNRDDSSRMYPTELNFSSPNQPQPNIVKKKRNPPCQPDHEAEVIAYSPKTLSSTDRFVCEICNKGFLRDQNLELHRRGHNLPWKLKNIKEKEAIRKKVYVCPEISCPHHDPSRALGDLTGLKKHFFRKHGEKKWKCDKCSKHFAIQSDWKAHAKTCGTRGYRCECGILFSRNDILILHKGFCDASKERTAPKTLATSISLNPPALTTSDHIMNFQQAQSNFNFTFPIGTLSPELPPSPLIGPGTTPLHQTTQSPSLFQDYFHQNFSLNKLDNDEDNLSPNPTTPLFYYPSPPLTASLANVFINPPQTHENFFNEATNGLGANLSTHEMFFQSLGSYGVEADAATGGSNTKSGVSAGVITGDFLSSSFFYDDMMMNSNVGSQGSALNENILFGGMNQYPSSQNNENFHATSGEFSIKTNNEEGASDESGEGFNEEMARDFSGLKSLFERDYHDEYNWFRGLFKQ